MLNLTAVLESSARAFPDREAVVLGTARYSYAAIDAAANRIANLLVERGIGAGERIALSCPNLADFPIVYFGILKIGAVVVPLNVLLKRDEIAYHLEDARAKAYFCFEGSAELPLGAEGWSAFAKCSACEHFFLMSADPGAVMATGGAQTLTAALKGMADTFESCVTETADTAVILYTSGTTGKPKGAELSHANILLNALALMRLLGEHPQGHDRTLVVLPLFHTFGQTVQMIVGFLQGSTLVFMPRFEASGALALLQSEEITCFAAVPAMYWGLLNALDDSVDVSTIAARLRVAVSGGAALPIEIHKQFQQRFGVRILEGYGLSETSPVTTFSRPDLPIKVGSIGVPIWGVEVKLIDADWNSVDEIGAVGEISVRGHNVMKGYFMREAETRAVMRDGWFRTGDLGRRDAEGAYYIVDRSKDMIIRGGFNVYPREVEELLITHPAVSLAAVVGVKDAQHGEEIMAFVIRKSGFELSEQDLIGWARDRIAAYKYPRSVEFRDSLPMTASGKILKRELVAARASKT